MPPLSSRLRVEGVRGETGPADPAATPSGCLPAPIAITFQLGPVQCPAALRILIRTLAASFAKVGHLSFRRLLVGRGRHNPAGR